MLFKSCILAALMTLASAAPSADNIPDKGNNPDNNPDNKPPADNTAMSTFLLIAVAEHESFHNTALVANDGKIWLGDKTMTAQICPPAQEGNGQCVPPSVLARTVFKHKTNEISLQTNSGVEQLLWVSKTKEELGAMLYNKAAITADQTADNAQATFSINHADSTKPASLQVDKGVWWACPSLEDATKFRVFVVVEELKITEDVTACKTFVTEIWSNQEWQY